MKSNKVYICHTYYHVLISLVKEIKLSKAEADIVICDSIPETEEIIESLNQSQVFNNVFFFSESKYKEKENIRRSKVEALFINFKYRKMIKPSFEINKESYKELFIFNDWTYFGYYLRSNKIYYTLLEDAKDSYKVLNNYVKINYKKSIIQKLFGFSYETLFFYGKSKYSKVVEVNDSEGIKIPKEKVRVSNKKEMFEKLTVDQKKKIYRIFIIDEAADSTPNRNGILILTQPLFEDSMVQTKEMQRKVYQDIIDIYCDGLDVTIKPHPRDLFNYKVEFNNVIVINKNIPTEILSFNNSNIKFQKAITVSSSSINGIDFVNNKINLGFEWLRKYQ